MDEAEARTLAVDLMETAPMVYVTTIQPDGYPHTRAVWNLRNRRDYGRLYKLFREHKEDMQIILGTNTSSNKVAHLKANPKTCVYFCDTNNYRGLTLVGDAETAQDKRLKEALWDPAWKFYYPGGVDDPDFTVIRMNPTNAAYYHRLDGCRWSLRKP